MISLKDTRFDPSSIPSQAQHEEIVRVQMQQRADHEWYMQQRHTNSDGDETGVEQVRALCFTDLVCDECGGAAWTDPDRSTGAAHTLRLRGHCSEHARRYSNAQAVDCRSYWQSAVLPERSTS